MTFLDLIDESKWTFFLGVSQSLKYSDFSAIILEKAFCVEAAGESAV